ncbi:MAG TPA: methyltransferase [bacterium]|nr:methyltransferase [bacterium]
MIDGLFSQDRIFDDRTVIKQGLRGYRFSVDALLLAWFVFRHMGKQKSFFSLELGAGSGVVSLLLKRHGLIGKIDCVERDAGLCSLLKENVEQNALSEQIFPLCGDLRFLRFSPEQYDIVFFNPPYHPPVAGRTSPDKEKATARHELFGSLDDFLQKGKFALKKKGRLFFIHPANRAVYAYAKIASHGLAPLETMAVREHETDDPSLFLYYCVSSDPIKTKQRFTLLTMKNNDGSDTPEGKTILYAPNRGTRT